MLRTKFYTFKLTVELSNVELYDDNNDVAHRIAKKPNLTEEQKMRLLVNALLEAGLAGLGLAATRTQLLEDPPQVEEGNSFVDERGTTLHAEK